MSKIVKNKNDSGSTDVPNNTEKDNIGQDTAPDLSTLDDVVGEDKYVPQPSKVTSKVTMGDDLPPLKEISKVEYKVFKKNYEDLYGIPTPFDLPKIIRTIRESNMMITTSDLEDEVLLASAKSPLQYHFVIGPGKKETKLWVSLHKNLKPNPIKELVDLLIKKSSIRTFYPIDKGNGGEIIRYEFSNRDTLDLHQKHETLPFDHYVSMSSKDLRNLTITPYKEPEKK